MELPDLTNLPLTALFTYLLLIAAIDVGFNVVMAFVHGNFSAIYVADFLRTHIVLRVFVIGALGILGHGVEALGVPAIPAVSLAATGGLAAYAIETIASLREGLTDTKPFPEPPTPTPSG
jgi:hypothetical protein